MPATPETAKILVARLARSTNFADDLERRKEVGRVLRDQCESDAHAESVVAAMVRALEKFPTVSQVWEFIETTQAPVVIGKADPNCERCAGGNLDWVPSARGGVQRCPCRGKG